MITSSESEHHWPIRRQHRRVQLDRPVAVQLSHWASLGARCIDISHGGMRLRISDPVKLGDQIIFDVGGAGRTFRLTGEVRHVAQIVDDCYEIGLCWVDSDERAIDLFETLIAGEAPPPTRFVSH